MCYWFYDYQWLFRWSNAVTNIYFTFFQTVFCHFFVFVDDFLRSIIYFISNLLFNNNYLKLRGTVDFDIGLSYTAYTVEIWIRTLSQKWRFCFILENKKRHHLAIIKLMIYKNEFIQVPETIFGFALTLSEAEKWRFLIGVLAWKTL